MAFFKRLADHLLNQVLVESLANSRWFQKFAVWSHGAMKELQSKAKDGSGTLDGGISKFADVAKETSQKFRKDFAEELRKVQEAMEQQKQMKK